jgi:hypothetical protein
VRVPWLSLTVKRVLREHREWWARLEKAKAEDRVGAFLDDDNQAHAIALAKPQPPPKTPMHAKLAERERIAELCRRPLR